MATPMDEHEHGPIAIAERVLDALFDQHPPQIAMATALDIAKALLPYRVAKLAAMERASRTNLLPKGGGSPDSET